MPHRLALLWLLFASLLAAPACAQSPASTRIPITVEANRAGAPITMGLPLPKGTLHSPDRVRVVTEGGTEVPAQVTEVTTWAPADSSLKWIWVFFFTESTDRYVVEYGPGVTRTPVGDEPGDRVVVRNNQRTGGYTEITTGPLRLRIQRTGRDTTGSGFLDRVWLDRDGDGFDEGDVVATGPQGRGSFLDLTDPNGPDSSRAVIDQTFVEEGSGPLHAVVRVEGEYRYGRGDNRAAPFVLRLHAYAGKPYVRVLHTLTYTGDPDRHPEVERQHALLATSPAPVANEDSLAGDSLWTVPNDRIRAAGLALDLRLDGPGREGGDWRYRTALQSGDWWDLDGPTLRSGPLGDAPLELVQSGPKPTRMPPVPASSPTERIGGFGATLHAEGAATDTATAAPGWMEVSGSETAVAVGTRHFLEEYPKALRMAPGDSSLTAFHWPDSAPPMSFARRNAEEDGGMVDNFAPGLTKTTELVFSFHDAGRDADAVRRTMDVVLDPPVAHAPPSWYTESRAFGPMAPRSEAFAEYERGMDYKFAWWHFNQHWEPWYGMFDYGDGRTYYFRDNWYLWTNNEPAVDFMWWRRFMRTGDRSAYLTALAQSRHAMDVDNIHWPTGPSYRGDTNSPYDFFRTQRDTTEATPYLGMGRRHGWQHWTALLSAHVWTPGWLAAYHLAGVHRGLDVARLTGDYYQRRIFGEHGLTGRRLYLSIWNLSVLYDATKDPALREELDDRVDRLLRLQEQRGGQMVIDRYGYTQVYVANGLRTYIQITGDEDAREGLVRHARWVRDNPPLDHEMESYLSSISVLLAGYQYAREPSLLREAVHRARHLKTDRLPKPVPAFATQEALAESLKTASRLPQDREGRCGIWCITGGLRVFGWTHAYTVPELVYWLQE
jgi:hypothetical protein